MPKQAIQNTIKARINGDKNHGWGVEDSYQCILAAIAANEGCEVKDIDTAEFGKLLKPLINPSAFRQSLEIAGLLTKNAKAEKEKSALKGLMDGLVGGYDMI